MWSIFPADTEYFGAGKQPFMLNYRVADLDELLVELAKEGVTIDPDRQNYEYGKFAWIVDPEGNRIELWEPPKGGPALWPRCSATTTRCATRIRVNPR